MKTAYSKHNTHIFSSKRPGQTRKRCSENIIFFPIHVCPPKKTLLGKQHFKKCFPTKSETYFYYFIPVWHTQEKNVGLLQFKQ